MLATARLVLLRHPNARRSCVSSLGSFRAGSGVFTLPTKHSCGTASGDISGRSTYMAATASAAAMAIVMVSASKPVSLQCTALAESGALSPLQVLDITSIVMERISIPMVPRILQEVVISQCVQYVSVELPKYLTADQLQCVRSGVDDAGSPIAPADRDRIVASIAESLKVPLVPLSAREMVAAAVVDAVLGDTSFTDFVSMASDGVVDTMSTLLDENGRICLAKKINEKVDLPLLSEAQEQDLFQKVVDMAAKPLESMIPKELRVHLKGVSRDEMNELKANLVSNLQAQIPSLPFIDKSKEKELLNAVVDVMIGAFLEGSGLGGVVLSPEIQLAQLDKEEQKVEMQLQLGQRQSARRRANLNRQLASIQEEKIKLRQELGHHYVTKALVGSAVLVAVAALTYPLLKH